MLASSTTLTSLAWHGHIDSGAENIITEINVNNKISTLTMEIVDSYNLHFMCQHMCLLAPNLTELYINYCDLETHEICNLLKSFGPSLLRLKLGVSEMPLEVRQHIVKYACQLVFLKVSFQMKWKNVWSKIISDNMPNCIIEEDIDCTLVRHANRNKKV
jgi:hypothetical protein